MADTPPVRASDADRERVAAALSRHCQEGRLALDELDERLAQVYAARTLADLNAPAGPLRELPALAPPPPAHVATAGRRPAPGGRAFPRHVAAYVATSLFLVAVWALSGGGYFWPVWVMAVWGIGVAAHGVASRPRAPQLQWPERPR